MKHSILSTSSEWTFELIATYDREIAKIAADFSLDTYPNQIEIISAEQMMDAYASSGMPLNYHHSIAIFNVFASIQLPKINIGFQI